MQIQINKLSIFSEEKTILNNQNLHFETGRIYGITGETGSGKSTLFNFLAGVLPEGFCVNQNRPDNLKLSYAFQDAVLLENVSCIKNLTIPLKKYFNKSEALKIASETLVQFNLENKLKNKAGELSGGEKQRLNLARAFAVPSNLLILDEPFSAQDDEKIQNIKNQIINSAKNQSKIILIGCHQEEELKGLADEFYNLTSQYKPNNL